MGLQPIGPTFDLSNTSDAARANPSDLLKSAQTAARTLNDLDIADREFKVVRDKTNSQFVIQVLERSTGNVVDQYPPEDILNLLGQLSGKDLKTGSSSA